jgi:peptidoglycan-associated lipoprotein
MSRTWNARLWWLGTVALVVAFAGCGGGAPEPEPEPAPAPAPQVQQPTAEEEAAARARAEEEARRLAEAEAARIATERNRVLTIIAERVHFDFDKSDIRPDAEQVLQRKVSVLRQYPGIALRFEGHCDERGSNEYNLALGQRRAEAVRRYLTSYGLDASRFATISYGEERPAAGGHDEEAWAANRRAEFVITASAGLPGGS